jgi:hypothetical protein
MGRGHLAAVAPAGHRGLPDLARASRAAALCALVLSAAGCGSSSGKDRAAAAQGRVVSFRVLDSGSRSGIAAPQEMVATSAEEWERLWQAHQAGAFPQRPLPAVDFSTSLCVAIFAGERPTGGFEVKIEQVVESANGLEVTYRVSRPPAGAIVSQSLTSPFEIIAVASRQTPVRFRRLPEA